MHAMHTPTPTSMMHIETRQDTYKQLLQHAESQLPLSLVIHSHVQLCSETLRNGYAKNSGQIVFNSPPLVLNIKHIHTTISNNLLHTDRHSLSTSLVSSSCGLEIHPLVVNIK